VRRLVTALVIVAASAAAQPYRCNWNVVGIGGSTTSSTSFRANSTAGQTAVGQISSTSFLALIGYWQSGYGVGIAEKQGPVFPKGLVTRLDAIVPNPFRDRTRVRYSLATEGPVSIVVLDLAGRAVRTLVYGPQSAGRHTAD
jgi:hypothetical protein